MKDKEQLLKEIKEKFEEVKKETKFKSNQEEINKIFYMEDAVLNIGFVSENFSRQLCARIVETYSNWNNYLHSIIFPNPQNMINMNESKMFNESEKKEIVEILTRSLALTSTNTLNGLTRDKQSEGRFIDDSVIFWKKTFHPKLVEIIKKVNNGWKKK